MDTTKQDRMKNFLAHFIDNNYFDKTVDGETLKYIAAETKENPLSEDAFESGFWDTLEFYVDEHQNMGDKEFYDLMHDEDICDFVNNYFVSKVEELYGPIEETEDEYVDESLGEANKRVKSSISKVYEELSKDSFEPSEELSKLYRED